jgi:hypothetical protein
MMMLMLLGPLLLAARSAGGAALTFHPPALLPADTSSFGVSGFLAFRTGSGGGSAVIGGAGMVSHDDGVSFSAAPALGKAASACGGCTAFVTMPDGSLHDTGLAGHGGGFANGSSSSNASSTFTVDAKGDITVTPGPAASFTGLPSPLNCTLPPGTPAHDAGDCMYGAGWAAWARAVQLADKTFVTTTALVWLGGHFGVTAEQAGIYSWRSKDSYNWEFAGRGATLPEFPGWDEMTGEPVDLVGTCEGAQAPRPICSDRPI